MHLERSGFNSILEDNEEHYYSLLQGVISAVDEYAYVQITKAPFYVAVRISPSEPSASQMMLKQILELHNMLQIKLDLSKSIANSTNIQYKISIFAQ